MSDHKFTYRYNEDNICTRCGAPFPRCMSNDMLACEYCILDMWDDESANQIIAEIKRRGLPLDIDADWIKNHKCIARGADDACVKVS